MAIIVQRQKVDATFDLKIESKEVPVRRGRSLYAHNEHHAKKTQKCLLKRYTDTGIKLDMLRRLMDGSA